MASASIKFTVTRTVRQSLDGKQTEHVARLKEVAREDVPYGKPIIKRMLTLDGVELGTLYKPYRRNSWVFIPVGQTNGRRVTSGTMEGAVNYLAVKRWDDEARVARAERMKELLGAESRRFLAFKWLKGNGDAPVGSNVWNDALPFGSGEPGKWLEVSGEIALCANGLHFLRPAEVCNSHRSERLFLAEVVMDGDLRVDDGNEKFCLRKARLLREITRPEDYAYTTLMSSVRRAIDNAVDELARKLAKERDGDEGPTKAEWEAVQEARKGVARPLTEADQRLTQAVTALYGRSHWYRNYEPDLSIARIVQRTYHLNKSDLLLMHEIGEVIKATDEYERANAEYERANLAYSRMQDRMYRTSNKYAKEARQMLGAAGIVGDILGLAPQEVADLTNTDWAMSLWMGLEKGK